MEKIIHQIWVGPYEIPEKEKYFLERNKKINYEFEHILWTDCNLPELPEKIKEHFNFLRKEKNYAFIADILRIFVIREFGGLYIDLDTKPIHSIHELNLQNYNGLIPHHDEFTVANTFFGCAKKTSYINYMYDNILKSNIGDYFFPRWFNKCLRDYYDVEDIPENEYHTEKCKIKGNEIVEKWKKDGMLSLAINKREEFKKYYEHVALYSWGGEQKKLFEEGNVNYLGTKYHITDKQYKFD